MTPGPLDPTWLEVSDVKVWLRLSGEDTSDDELVRMCAAAVEPWVERSRRDRLRPDPNNPTGPATYQPDGEVYQAAVALAGRVVRRRNSPGGTEALAETVSYVASFDPDIDRALRRGRYTVPGVG